MGKGFKAMSIEVDYKHVNAGTWVSLQILQSILSIYLISKIVFLDLKAGVKLQSSCSVYGSYLTHQARKLSVIFRKDYSIRLCLCVFVEKPKKLSFSLYMCIYV